MKKVTLAEVASKAGVSSATVSRYLKQENVRKDIVERIEAAIKETGYLVRKNDTEQVSFVDREKNLPKNSAPMIKKKSMKFMVLTKDLKRSRMQSMMTALKDVLYANGCSFQICVSNNDPQNEETYLTSAIVSNLDGIIVESCTSKEFIKKQMRTTSIPVVFLEKTTSDDTGAVIDEIKAGEVVGHYLLNKEYLIIRYISCDTELANAHIQGIKNIYHEQKQPIDLVTVDTKDDFMDIYEHIKEAFVERIDLLILQQDEMAIPLSKYTKEYHVAIPQNVSVICFGGGDLLQVLSPSLSSLAYDNTAYANMVYTTLVSMKDKRIVQDAKQFFEIKECDSTR